MFFSYNLDLLKICYEYCRKHDMKLNLRMHPNNRLEWFRVEESLTLINQELRDSVFIVGHTSSLLYECLKAGLPAFKFRSQIPSNKTREELCFSNCTELESVSATLLANLTQLADWSSYYIESVGDDSIRQYRKYFETQSQQLTPSSV